MSVGGTAAVCVIWLLAGIELAGVWWRRELNRRQRFDEDISKQTKESYEKEIEAYRSHISRLHRRLGLELLDEQDYVN